MLEDNENKELIYQIGGAILGFIFVKAIIFNIEDDSFWHTFWNYLFNGRIVWEYIYQVFVSWTFIKLAIGTYLGSLLGKSVANGSFQEFVKNFKEEMGKEEKDKK